MPHKFNRLDTNSAFPHIDNVDVYRFDNAFDYSRYDYTQMDLQICAVPWDMGEAHVGNRTISGIGNVVYFGSKENRDKWFDDIPDGECIRFSTKFKELHREHVIDVPIPYDVAARFNYLKVHYNLFANDDSPVVFEDDTGVRDWFWFIREVEFVAPNTTRLHLLEDAFQTWIYDVTITGMMLERGHAPMLASDVDAYLSNPVENSKYLLTPDVNFGEISQARHSANLVFNEGYMYACIATTGVFTLSWGSKSDDSWKVRARSNNFNNGNPSVNVYALPASDLSGFLVAMSEQVPQAIQTIQGVFFAAEKMITLGEGFEFCGYSMNRLTSTRRSFSLIDFEKSMFGYGRRYQNISKLYTSPYAHIEITDESGNVDIVRIEDTIGALDVSAALSIAYPFVSIDAHIIGAGGTSAGSVSFLNVYEHSFPFGGTWYETLKTWKVPTFAVVLDPGTQYDYATHYDRIQRVNDYTKDYANAETLAAASKSDRDASADTGKSNADASANAQQANTSTLAAANKSNADAAADTLVSNTALQTAANSSITSRSNSASVSDTTLSNELSQALQAWEAGYARNTANNDVDAAYASAAIGAAGGALNSAISGASSGAVAGPAGAIAGAVGGLVTGAISGATSLAQTAVAANLTTAQAEETVSLSQSKVSETSRNNSDRTTNQNSANTANANTTNTASTGMSANSAATQKANATRTRNAENTAAANSANTDKANATRTQTTEKANAQRDYNAAIANAGRDRSNAQAAISNDILQADMRSPFVYGAFADGESSANKPQALFANVVTQPKGAIALAGDEMLRYGYALERYWEFDGNWCVGKYFTYWKLSDFWVSDLNVPDMYMDRLRFFLFGGVTVWKDPDDIGKRSIYDNFS